MTEKFPNIFCERGVFPIRKILFCASSAQHLERFHQPYMQSYREGGWEVHTACKGKVNCPSVTKNIDLPMEKGFSLLHVVVLWRLMVLFRREKYTQISVHTTLAAAFCRVALLFSGQRKTELHYTCHGYLFRVDKQGKICRTGKDLLYFGCEKLLSIRTDRLLVMNREDWNTAQRYHLCKDIGFLWGMGVPVEKFEWISAEKRRQVRKQLGAPPASRVFLCVGEFSKRKNQKMILEALALVLKRTKGIYMVFAGTGALLEENKKRAKQLGVNPFVRFLGNVEEMPILYRAADVLVTASCSEGLPFNVLEGLLCQLPVLATRIKGHVDLIQEGKNGFLVELDDTEALAEKMILLVESEKKYRYIRENAVLEEKYCLKECLKAVQ